MLKEIGASLIGLIVIDTVAEALSFAPSNALKVKLSDVILSESLE